MERDFFSHLNAGGSFGPPSDADITITIKYLTDMKKTILSMVLLGGAALVANAQTGSATAPLSVDEFIALGVPSSAVADTYVQGYIVGTCTGTSLSSAEFDATANSSNTNILLAASSSETSTDYCVAVQLPAGDVRTALSLAAHPQNLGHEVMLCGSREKYFGTYGLKSVSSYEWIGEAPGPDAPPSVEETATEANPHTVTSFLALGTPGAAVAGTWVEGYIVGYVPGMSISDAVFSSTAPDGGTVSATNILIAADANTTDINACIPVQLPAGDIRSGLNLADNPSNLGKKVELCGSREAYFSVNGLKSVDTYILDGKRVTTVISGTTTVNSVAATVALGTKTNVTVNYPLTVAFVNAKNVFACDANGDFIQVYGSNTYAVNDVIPAGWDASYELYGSTTPELVPLATLPAATSTAAFEPALVDGKDISVAMVNSVVTIKNVEFPEATPDTKDNFQGVADGETLSFRNNYTYPGVAAGTYNVTVVVTVFEGAPSLYVIKFSEASAVNEVSEAAANVYALNGNIVAPEGARVFNLNGVETGVNNLPAGVYVVVVAEKAVKVLVK